MEFMSQKYFKIFLSYRNTLIKVLCVGFLSWMAVFAADKFISYFDLKEKTSNFNYICKMIFPRVQVGASREVQDTLLSLFEGRSGENIVFPVVTVDGKNMTMVDVYTNQQYDCPNSSVQSAQVSFHFNEKELSGTFFALYFAIVFLCFFWLFLFGEKLVLKRQEVRTRRAVEANIAAISRQVAHDIRSPLTALDLAIGSPRDFEEKKSLFLQASSRIRAIADELLVNSKYHSNLYAIKNIERMNKPNRTFDICKCVDGIVVEKNASLKKYVIKVDSKVQSLEVLGHKEIFERILSNILQNSVDIVPDEITSLVEVSIRKFSKKVQVVIKDNGKGIPPEVLAKLGEYEVTFGKSDGNGLGVLYSKKKVLEMGGQFSISSTVGHGTLVSITLNKA